MAEVIQMLTRFPEPSRTAFGVAALTGLRRGEVEGLNWEDYHDGQLFVNRTISRIGKLRELPPKPKKSRAPVPVVPALRELLEEHHHDCPNPKAGPIFASILRDGRWARISLDNLRTRQMLPALNRCKHCGLADGKKHLKEAKDGHKFERDPRIVAWRGWHCARSGFATTLDAFGVSLNVISRTLRHSNTSVTANHYIKPNLDAVSAGMRQLSEKIAVRNRPDSDQTVISPSGRSAETVN